MRRFEIYFKVLKTPQFMCHLVIEAKVVDMICCVDAADQKKMPVHGNILKSEVIDV